MSNYLNEINELKKRLQELEGRAAVPDVRRRRLLKEKDIQFALLEAGGKVVHLDIVKDTQMTYLSNIKKRLGQYGVKLIKVDNGSYKIEGVANA